MGAFTLSAGLIECYRAFQTRLRGPGERLQSGAASGRAGRRAAHAPVPCRPRRPQADHLATLEPVHEERFEPTSGSLRRAARTAVHRLLDRRRPPRSRPGAGVFAPSSACAVLQ